MTIAPDRIVDGAPARLCAGLWQVTGTDITHPWDAAAYLVEGPRPVLIDCGSGLGAANLERHLRSLGVTTAPRLLGTHGHFDHVAGAAALGLPLGLHRADHEAVLHGDPVRTTAGLLYRCEFPHVELFAVEDGDVFDTRAASIRAVAVPGHTPGSVAYVVDLDDSRVLIPGDCLWGGWHPQISTDLDVWAKSLDRLRVVGADAVVFPHGTPRLYGDVDARLAEARARFGEFFDPWFKPFYRSFTY